MKVAKASFTASEARENLYALIRQASLGIVPIEITLQKTDPVVLIRKDELESWQETLDILSSPSEMKALRENKKEPSLTHNQLLQALEE